MHCLWESSTTRWTRRWRATGRTWRCSCTGRWWRSTTTAAASPSTPSPAPD
ncbi:hypothetical protein QJS66_04995 [Kocuria rhizophila]|nr:hypothetical protein QJS66_04995 [Kocuria rhizophila]